MTRDADAVRLTTTRKSQLDLRRRKRSLTNRKAHTTNHSASEKGAPGNHPGKDCGLTTRDLVRTPFSAGSRLKDCPSMSGASVPRWRTLVDGAAESRGHARPPTRQRTSIGDQRWKSGHTPRHRIAAGRIAGPAGFGVPS